MKDITYSGNELSIGDISIELPYPISQILTGNDIVIVRLDTLGKTNYPRNIWAFNADCSLRWKIEKADEYNGAIHPYTNISFKKKNIRAYNWNGCSYVIDPKTGEIENKEFIG